MFQLPSTLFWYLHSLSSACPSWTYLTRCLVLSIGHFLIRKIYHVVLLSVLS